ncbi:MAG: type II toxin-antitoxin system RelE/ParE family toxin [Burkholderiales bacterium]|jgi:mRNA interferase RelE/StbE|nr:type II toxin-antitoxin system RelE/ParE family toxin [Burkholderiales bacterium]
MTWHVIYHHAVADDLRVLGDAAARIILNVITKRIQHGEPDKLGKPLAGRLAGYRRIRTGSTRIVYRVNASAIEVLIIAVGQRRDAEVYSVAEERV